MDKKKVTNIEVKKKNRNRVFRYICKHGTVSNPDISYGLKISLPTATQITKELIEQGLVKEKGEMDSTGGRRAKALAVVRNAKLAAGLDITKNHITLALTNIRGDLINYERIYLPYVPKDAYYCEVNEKLESFLNESDACRDKLLGIGISFPGIIDQDRGLITHSHVLGVKAVPLAMVSRFFPYPCIFLNDANAGAYAEAFGEEGMERFFYFSLSNAVGGAVFSENELVQGKNFRCGEVGHMTVVVDGERCYCGKKGCLDTYCAAGRLADAADGKLEQFFILLDQKDEQAVKIWDSYTTYLAIAINNIHMILDCDVVLGGYVGSYMGTHLKDIWNKVSERNTFEEKECYIRACNYKVAAAALGAAFKIMEGFISCI